MRSVIARSLVHSLFICVLALISLAASIPALATVQYTVTDLGALSGGRSWATGINDKGQVVGYADTDSPGGRSGDNHAFLYSNGVMTDLGTLGGYSSEAYGINSSGQVVGYADLASGKPHAFLYDGGTMIDFGPHTDDWSYCVQVMLTASTIEAKLWVIIQIRAAVSTTPFYTVEAG